MPPAWLVIAKVRPGRSAAAPACETQKSRRWRAAQATPAPVARQPQQLRQVRSQMRRGETSPSLSIPDPSRPARGSKRPNRPRKLFPCATEFLIYKNSIQYQKLLWFIIFGPLAYQLVRGGRGQAQLRPRAGPSVALLFKGLEADPIEPAGEGSALWARDKTADARDRELRRRHSRFSKGQPQIASAAPSCEGDSQLRLQA